MDIDRSNYWQRLPLILEAISEAQYLSIDLEMSGIATKNVNHTLSASLQQLYEDAKAAAQTYNILQVGLTCISWNNTNKAYVIKTFNAPLALSMVGGDQYSDQLSSQLERQIGFSSKAIAFLQTNSFQFSHVFDKGIPYLSALEAAHDDLEAFLEEKMDYEHIKLGNHSPETDHFYKDMRSRIQAWVNQQAFWEQSSPLLLTSPYNGRFNRFQKQLVRQLVETEFPGYKVQSRDGSLHLEVTWDMGPNPYTKELRRQAVAKQYGFAHVWAAMTGQRFAAKIDKGLIATPQMEQELGRELSEYEQRIRFRRPIIVGHNMLWDLCFLFRTFEGQLPDTVEDFQRLLRLRMPRIVDTKYLCTRGHHEMMPDLNLEQCFLQAKYEKLPLVLPGMLYSSDKPAIHQAGYDSYMTAVVFLKRAYHISETRKGFEYIPAEDHEENKAGPLFTCNGSSKWARRIGRRAINMSGSLLDSDDDSLATVDAKFKPMIPVSSSAPEMVYEMDEEEDEYPAKLPDWTDEQVLWNKYGNKVRGGRAGVFLYTGPKRVVV